MTRRWSVSLLALISLWMVSPAQAQTPAPAPPPSGPWTGTVSGGFALTNGNTDTTSFNAGYEFLYNWDAKNRLKSDALYLRAKTDDELTADRLGFNGREEYRLTSRAYLFGQLQFLRDRFKEIDYLWAPAGGAGYDLIQSMRTTLSVDAGLGGVWEKNPGLEVSKSASIALGEKLTHKITPASMLTQYASALYKTNNFDDALYIIGASLAASISSRTQLKFEVVDTYKNVVPDPTLVNNDVAVLFSIVYKRQ